MSLPKDITLLGKEEIDLLARSNKKVKFVSDRDDAGDGQNVDEEMDSHENSERKKTSYRDMIVATDMANDSAGKPKRQRILMMSQMMNKWMRRNSMIQSARLFQFTNLRNTTWEVGGRKP